MPTTIIDKLYSDTNALIEYLGQKEQISFQTTVRDNFRKTLLLASASYFESILVDNLSVFFHEHTKTADVVLHFIKNKAMTRQYHSYFSWDAKNANTFFALFGDNFKQYIQDQVKNDEKFDEAIKAFLELGNYRNLLVHQNFANYDLPKTADEVYALYKKALQFVEIFPQKLDEYCKQSQPGDTE